MLALLLALNLLILHPKPLHHNAVRDTTQNWVVIHETESCGSPASVISYFRHSGKSSHYLIARNGTIYDLIDPMWKASHAGLSFFVGMHHWNDFAIGIEFMACKGQRFTEKQYQSGKYLIVLLEHRYKDIDSTRIVRHSQIASGRKHDPGPLFDMSRILPHPLDKPKPPL